MVGTTYKPNQWRLPRNQKRYRSTRWWLLLVIIATIAFSSLPFFVSSGQPRTAIGLFTPMLILLASAARRSPFTFNAYLTRGGLDLFDEFERAALYEALRRSYLIIWISLMFVFAWMIGAAELILPLPTQPRQWQAIVDAVIICIIALPVTIAEFTVPMPDTDDD